MRGVGIETIRLRQDMHAMVRDSESGSWPSSQERRRFGRFATRLPVTMRRDDLMRRGQPESRARCLLQLQDFSLGGLRAEGAVRLKVNERLTLHLPANRTHPALELTGRVVHCRRMQNRYQIGIEFCQTRAEAETSPYRQLPRLFSLALSYAPGNRPDRREDS